MDQASFGHEGSQRANVLHQMGVMICLRKGRPFQEAQCLTEKVFGSAIVSIHIPETVMQIGQWAWLG